MKIARLISLKRLKGGIGNWLKVMNQFRKISSIRFIKHVKFHRDLNLFLRYVFRFENDKKKFDVKS